MNRVNTIGANVAASRKVSVKGTSGARFSSYSDAMLELVKAIRPDLSAERVTWATCS